MKVCLLIKLGKFAVKTTTFYESLQKTSTYWNIQYNTIFKRQIY